jgi:hypothetical protein
MMVTTHMGCGFVVGFTLALILALLTSSPTVLGLSGFLAVCGALGGFIPDIDRIEHLGPIRMTHRKTLHYPIGYGILALVLVYIGIILNAKCLYLASLFLGAWLHSFMDIFDDFYLDPDHGVYEHIRKKWIKPRRLIPFASRREWSLQSLCDVAAISISPFISGIYTLSGWILTALTYLVVWFASTFYEFKYTVPKRLAMINEALKTQRART